MNRREHGDVDVDAILRMCNDDRRLARQYIECFIANTPRYVDDLKSAIQQRNCAGLVNASHGLRGSAALIGADTLQRITEQVEHAGQLGNIVDAANNCEELLEEVNRCMARLRACADEFDCDKPNPEVGNATPQCALSQLALDIPVIVVDDDPVVQTTLKLQIESRGLKVHTAADGRDGYDLICRTQPCICVIDWMLPGLDGLSLVRQVRDNEATQNTYVIMLTAKTDSRELLRAFEMGVNDFVSKSPHAGELLARLEAALRMISLQRQLENQVQEASRLNDHLVDLNQKLHTLATTDMLTMLPNRRAVIAQLEHAWQQWRRYEVPLCVAMVDIDHFKSINDRFGHDMGDEVLKHIGMILRNERRGAEIIGRIGGEEFVIGLLCQTLEPASESIQRLLETIRYQPVRTSTGEKLEVTASIGLVQATDQMQNIGELMRAADQLLYQAKQSGRDQLCTA